jgi:hypothetical protein
VTLKAKTSIEGKDDYGNQFGRLGSEFLCEAAVFSPENDPSRIDHVAQYWLWVLAIYWDNAFLNTNIDTRTGQET